jgi:hypothetical protein
LEGKRIDVDALLVPTFLDTRRAVLREIRGEPQNDRGDEGGVTRS